MMEHWLAPIETDLDMNQLFIILVYKWNVHVCLHMKFTLYAVKRAWIPVMPDVPFLDCVLFLAMAAAAPP